MNEDAEINVTDRTLISLPEKHTECCGNYIRGVDELNRFITNVHISDYDDIYRGKPFEYCPWCGRKK